MIKNKAIKYATKIRKRKFIPNQKVGNMKQKKMLKHKVIPQINVEQIEGDRWAYPYLYLFEDLTSKKFSWKLRLRPPSMGPP
jgi:hypothetical protein